MFKKLCLTLCLTAFLAWADEFDDFDDDAGAVSAANTEAAAPAESAGAGSDDEFEEVEDSQMSRSKREDMEARKKFEEDQRADEYANSLRRRDWLKDRLMLQIGMGSRYPFMGETGMGMGFGAGAEYITRWHFGLYGSFGFLPKGTDTDFDDIELEGGTGYKVGLNYYLFPKNPLHLGLSVSYGTVYFDHNVKPDDGIRPLIKVDGFQFDAIIAYLTNEWYYLQFSFGMYYAPKLAKKDESNPSLRWTDKRQEALESAVVNEDGMSKTGIVFGIAIGYALPEFFPDDTEKRRREREKERERSGR
ncbi:MAG: hypothetical protein IKJ76_07080 [Fibrobacter sp.]|uniref:hypothetical protein n=1 Tax=Fibrobacter sp. TaxID=35828 RepID=UPI00388F3A72|nr:hypothetical protein [Fibrobacter sp.]